MERTRNSDSETHVKKYNRTSGTDLSLKSLWDIFLGHPVSIRLNMTQITKTKSELISTSNDDGQEVEQRLK